MKILGPFIFMMMVYIIPSSAQVSYKFNTRADCTMNLLEENDDCISKAVNASFYMPKEYKTATLTVNNITYHYRILDTEIEQLNGYTLLTCSVMASNNQVYLMAVHLLDISPQITIINIENFTKTVYYFKN